jgi:hypothetical protein
MEKEELAAAKKVDSNTSVEDKKRQAALSPSVEEKPKES